MIYVYVIDFVLALIFGVSLFAKCLNPKDFSMHIRSYGIIPHQYCNFITVLVIGAEGALLIGFVFQMMIKVVVFFGVVVVCFFTIILWRAKKDKLNNNICACFGEIHWLNKHGIFRNVLIISILLVRFQMPVYEISQITGVIKLLSLSFLVACIENLTEWKKLRSSKNANRNITYPGHPHQYN
ncbi:MauE/DoxX family redox-associated membrane protein [Marinicrinis sediminis]|uniref:MauE/DoxX family redox-associated membrane protein n=1 Tax=Marinicrinis sediminis TaxID=1652465 RepID=A0ABW5R8G0_9BACL